MQYKFVSILAALAAVTHGFVFEGVRNTPDGVYIITHGLRFQEVRGPVQVDLENVEIAEAGVGGDVACLTGDLPEDDYVAAQNMLNAYCGTEGQTVYPLTAVAAKVGGAVAFMCTYSVDENGNVCQNGEFNDSLRQITEQCGTWHAGSLNIPDWGKAYGIDALSADICGNNV